jgi:hypothetical protein
MSLTKDDIYVNYFLTLASSIEKSSNITDHARSLLNFISDCNVVQWNGDRCRIWNIHAGHVGAMG